MSLEALIGWLGAGLAYATLALLAAGIAAGIRRKPAAETGRSPGWLHAWWFYAAASAVFFAVSWLLWKPLPMELAPPARTVTLVVGAVLYFPAMLVVLWARLLLGRDYFVSTSRGAQVFAGQRLVTGGPYAWVRHPMYAGLVLAAAGSLLIYFTWTTLFFVLIAPYTARRARQEEIVLAQVFGEEWQAYRRRVPAWIPRPGRWGKSRRG